MTGPREGRDDGYGMGSLEVTVRSPGVRHRTRARNRDRCATGHAHHSTLERRSGVASAGERHVSRVDMEARTISGAHSRARRQCTRNSRSPSRPAMRRQRTCVPLTWRSLTTPSPSAADTCRQNAALALEIVRIRRPVGKPLVVMEGAGLAEQHVPRCRPSVIDTGDDRAVAQVQQWAREAARETRRVRRQHAGAHLPRGGQARSPERHGAGGAKVLILPAEQSIASSMAGWSR